MPEKRDKQTTGRKLSTTSRSTMHSSESQPFDAPDTASARKKLKEYQQIFSMFDTDGSGAIGNAELKQAMLSIGIHANEAEIDNVIREVVFGIQNSEMETSDIPKG
ncbi:EF hand [Necator americanus]|uniref:EF hand n=1 Tax=Necator americanus TaxID=51031 RepID=W2SP17_NECAM|nr:EF hand [Necator americanus]ETN71434.1 EF hand [Necator americanus]